MTVLLDPPVSEQVKDVRFRVQSMRSELAVLRGLGAEANAAKIESMSMMMNLLAAKVHKLEERIAAQENQG